MNYAQFEKQRSWEVQKLLPTSQKATVFSPSNIALSKYWGKRDIKLNLPTNGSLSATLADFGSFTTVEFDASFVQDELFLNGTKEAVINAKAKSVLDLLRAKASVRTFARVQTANNFPTAAGLASSASGLSALTAAAAFALGLDLPLEKLSEVARQGSGSACRSFFGGFAEWKKGERADGADSVAFAVAGPSHWPLDVIVAVVKETHKAYASTSAMEHTRTTSPYFQPWIETAEKQLALIRTAVLKKDFEILALETETNCLRMHASSQAAHPPILYWQPKTIEVMQMVWQMRKEGIRAFFTIDAGPNVVVFVEPQDRARCFERVRSVEGLQFLETKIGEGCRKISDNTKT